MAGRWCSPGTQISSTNKTKLHDIAEILLKVALSTITLAQTCILNNTSIFISHITIWHRTRVRVAKGNPRTKQKFCHVLVLGVSILQYLYFWYAILKLFWQNGIFCFTFYVMFWACCKLYSMHLIWWSLSMNRSRLVVFFFCVLYPQLMILSIFFKMSLNTYNL